MSPAGALLAAILILNIALKIRFFCGLAEADDFSYGVYAYSLFRIPWTWDMMMDFRVLRLTLILPVALLFRIVPPGETAAVLYPMIVSTGTVAVVYLIGRRLYGQNAGLLAAFVYATFPADVIYGTMLLPDGVVPFYISCAVLFFLAAEDSECRSRILYGLSGMMLFLAFTTRENSYNFALFFLPFAFNRERWKRGFYFTAVGFAVPVILLYTVYFIKSGDFLFNLHLAEHYRDPLIASGYIPPNAKNWYTIAFFMLPGLFSGVTARQGFISGLFGFTMYAGIAAAIYSAIAGAVKKNYRLLMPLWWFMVVYLYLEFGTISFDSYQMMKKLDRFILTLTPALALGLGILLTDAFALGDGRIDRKMLRRVIRNRRALLTGVVSTVAMIWILVWSYRVADYQKGSRETNMRFFRWGYHEVLADRPVLPVYTTGGWWPNKLSFYYMPDIRFAEMPWRKSDMIRDLADVETPGVLCGSHVIIDRRHFTGDNDLRIRHSYGDYPSFIQLPPEEWTLLGNQYGVEIYEVPDTWTYTPYDGKALVYKTMLLSLEVRDPALLLFCLAPDFINTLQQESFTQLFRALSATDNPARDELLGSRLEYQEVNGLWKIRFNLD